MITRKPFRVPEKSKAHEPFIIGVHVYIRMVLCAGKTNLESSMKEEKFRKVGKDEGVLLIDYGTKVDRFEKIRQSSGIWD